MTRAAATSARYQVVDRYGHRLLSGWLTGAVVNGPNSADLFEEGLGVNLDGLNRRPADGSDQYAEFTGHGSRYVDDVRSWEASEPADDFAAIAVYALTR